MFSSELKIEQAVCFASIVYEPEKNLTLLRTKKERERIKQHLNANLREKKKRARSLQRKQTPTKSEV
jgi:hypothetical protein